MCCEERENQPMHPNRDQGMHDLSSQGMRTLFDYKRHNQLTVNRGNLSSHSLLERESPISELSEQHCANLIRTCQLFAPIETKNGSDYSLRWTNKSVVSEFYLGIE